MFFGMGLQQMKHTLNVRIRNVKYILCLIFLIFKIVRMDIRWRNLYQLNQ